MTTPLETVAAVLSPVAPIAALVLLGALFARREIIGATDS
jgi:hypothetical protein